MKKKIIYTIFFLVIVFCIGLWLHFKTKNREMIEKIYLSEEYYESHELIEVTKEELQEKKNETYILYTYNSYCSFPIPCDSIFKEFMETYEISFLSIPFVGFKETSFYTEIKYAPSIIIIHKNKIVDYLDANSDEDIDKYQDVEELKEWLQTYISLTKEATE